MQRFFLPISPLGKSVTVSEDSFVHQISRVLRSRIGDTIVLFNGDWREYVYSIDSLAKNEVGLSFQSAQPGIAEPRTRIHLYQALPNKYEKIEYILQKGVEVWISEFVFFRSDRSQRLDISPRKTERFREIVREAAEQCGGNHIPRIVFSEGKIPFPETGNSYMFHTDSRDSGHMHDIDPASKPVNLFIGPEGGWSLQEIAYFEKKDVRKISLGERILRTETTGPVVAFCLIQR